MTVEDEIVHSKAYVSIQNYRFEGTIELVTDFSEEVLTRSIPKITLQPLIENSILHGILEKTDEGIIRITGNVKVMRPFFIWKTMGSVWSRSRCRKFLQVMEVQ
ncbi:MAG: sensor histidine kinase [Ruminococcus sp.]